MNNYILIKHQDGDCTFQVKSIELALYETGLDIEIRSNDNRDCCLGFLPSPSIYLENIAISSESIGSIQYEEVDIELGWEHENGEEKEENVSRIYMGEHLPLNKTKLILSRVSETELSIALQSTASDFNYYDERAKDNPIEAKVIYKNA
ncbi:hypothetical protein ACG1BZ_14830 [Microbulbifer sp. CNSA002]|uniref:hypothetical protein n=1 Tax=Microbulbifer sp. CNSA002 TaxID=3373604 RepID=UPI0039B38093